MPDRPTRTSAPISDPASQRALLLLPPFNAVLELALFVVVVLAVDAFVPSFSLNNFEPNPSWLPVLLLSVQYGTVSGLLAAGVCIALSMQTGFPEQDVGENLFVYLLRAWAQPMLWIGAAVILGQFRTRHIAERAELAQELSTLSSQRTAIAEYANNLRARCDALERHLASRDGPEAVTVLAELARIGQAAPGDLVISFERAISATLPNAAVSLHVIEGDGVRCLAATGAGERPDQIGQLSGIAAWSPLLRASAERPHCISVLTAEGERLLAGRALVAAPIEVAGGIGGMMLVHSIDPQALTADLTIGLPVLAAALAPMVEVHLLGGADDRAAGGATQVSSSGQAFDTAGTDLGNRAGTGQPWLKRLWKPWASPAAAPARSDPPTRRLVR